MKDKIVTFPAENQAEKLIERCEAAGVYVYIKTDNNGIFPLFELHSVADPEKAIAAMMQLLWAHQTNSNQFRIDLTNYAFSVGSTLVEGYTEPPFMPDGEEVPA